MLEPATAAISSYSWTSAGVAGMLLTLCWHCCSYSVACWNRRACAFQNGQRLRWMEKHKRQAEKRPDEDNKESEMGLKKKKGGRKLVLCHIQGVAAVATPEYVETNISEGYNQCPLLGGAHRR